MLRLSLPLLVLLKASPLQLGMLRLVLAGGVLAVVILLLGWYRQQRKGAGVVEQPAPSDAPLQSATRVYTVEEVLGAAGTRYGQALRSELAQLETALASRPDNSLPTAPPVTSPSAEPPAEPAATSEPETAPAEPAATSEPETAPAAAPPTEEPAGTAPAPGATESAPAAAPAAPAPAPGGGQEVEEFSQAVSAPPELRPAPAKRFAARRAALNPEAVAKLQKTRSTVFVETHTGQHIPMLQEND